MKWRQGRGSDDGHAPGEARFEIEFDDVDNADYAVYGAMGADAPEPEPLRSGGAEGGIAQTAAVVAAAGHDSDEVASRELPGWMRPTRQRVAALAAAVALVAGSVLAIGQVRAVQQRDRNRYTVVVLSGKYVPGAQFPALNYDVTLLDQGPATVTVLTLEVYAPGLFDAYAWRISGLPVGKPTQVMLQGFYVCVGDGSKDADSVIMSVTGPTGRPDSLTLNSTLTGPGLSPSWLDQRQELCSGIPRVKHLKVQTGRPVGVSGLGSVAHPAP